MINLPDYIVYLWLLPLILFVVLPLCLSLVYFLGRFIGFMLFPRRMREQEVKATIPERDMEQVL